MASSDFRDGGFESEIEALEDTLEGASPVVAAFDAELSRMRASLGETSGAVNRVSNATSRGLRRAIDGIAFDGKSFADAIETVAKSVTNATYAAAMQPVTDTFGSMIGTALGRIGAVPFADGGAFTQGRVMPFAKGGVVTGPTYFPMRGGTGLMGEAGAEAIMPLTRGPDGSLGVRAQGGGGRPVNVVMNIQTPDAASFARSQSQIAARMNRVLSRGQRNA